MITDCAHAAATRMSRRYAGHPRFDHEDARQSALLFLLEHPESNEGRQILRMRRGIATGFANMGYSARIPLTELSKIRKGTRPPPPIMKDTADDSLEILAQKASSTNYEAVEDSLLVTQLLRSVTDPEDQRVLRYFLNNKRFPLYRTRQHKRDKSETRSVDQHRLSLVLNNLRNLALGS